MVDQHISAPRGRDWSRLSFTRNVRIVLLTFSFFWLGGTKALADKFDPQTTLYRQLMTPMTSVIDGQPFRDAIDRVAEQTGLNVCLDRRVDPTSPVHAGQLGPTVYSALKTIASKRDCVVMPVAGVLLVGRPEWVDTAAGLLIQMRDRSQEELIDVAWEDLTTPGEAIKLIVREKSEIMDLPHDLWPKTRWKRIDRGVARALLLAQFDRWSDIGQPLGDLIQRSYDAGKYANEFRALVKRADKRGQVKGNGNELVARASATTHRIASIALLDLLAAEIVAKPVEDAVFSLKLKQHAGAAIAAFAQRSGRQCLINDDAQEAAETFVDLQATNKTLRELAEIVASKAGLAVEWNDKQVVVSKAR